jgi:hypothetical protein
MAQRGRVIGVMGVMGLALVVLAGVCWARGEAPSGRASGASPERVLHHSTQPGHAITYGLDVNPADPTIGLARVPQVLRLVAGAGASAVRIGGNWATEEPSPGHYNFSQVDQLFSVAKTNGLTVLFELGKEPAWDALERNSNAPPSDCDAPSASCASVAQYVTALVDHAAPEGLRFLIVRNEPQDYSKNWVGGDPASYAHFQDVVYRAAHAADAAIEVLNGGTEAVTPPLVRSLTPQATRDAKAIAFATALYSDPVWCHSFDVLDLHVGDFGPKWSPKIVDASESADKACNGGRSMPVWVTEVGYPSVPSLQESPVHAEELDGRYQGGEEGQAQFLTDTFGALAHADDVIGIDWTFTVDPNVSQVPPARAAGAFAFDDGFGDGLISATYQTKDSYRAFQAFVDSRSRTPSN